MQRQAKLCCSYKRFYVTTPQTLSFDVTATACSYALFKKAAALGYRSRAEGIHRQKRLKKEEVVSTYTEETIDTR